MKIRSGRLCEWKSHGYGLADGVLTDKRTDAVVNTGYEKRLASLNAKCLVHNELIVCNDVDATELSKDLNSDTVHQSSSPLRNSEHDGPAWSSYSLFGENSSLNIVELLVDPIIYMAALVRVLSFIFLGFKGISDHFFHRSEAF